MANPSISVPDELLEDFDRAIARKQADGDLPSNTNRSQVIQQFMRAYAEGKLNSPPTAQTAD